MAKKQNVPPHHRQVVPAREGAVPLGSRHRRLATILFALLAAVLLSAGQAQMAASGTLKVLGFGMPDEIASVRVDQFKEQYPEVDLQLTEGSIDQQQLLTAIASGNPPDLIYLDRGALSTYASRGAIQPLDQCISQSGIDMSQFRTAATASVTVQDHVYGIPEFSNIIVLVVNTDALDQAGISLDEFGTSDWDALARWNDELTIIDGGKLTRIGFDPKLPEFLPLWVRANGGQLLSDDGRTAQLNSKEAVEALEFTAKLHDAAGGRAPFLAFRDTWDFFGADNQMAADQLAAFPIEQWFVNVLSDVSPDAPIAVKAFTDRQGNPLTFETGSAWAIPTGAANPDAACAFMQTMTSPATWEAAAQERANNRAAAGATYTGTYTANKVADEAIFTNLVKPSGNSKFDDAVKVILAAQDNAFSIPANPAGAEFKQAWTDAVNRVLNGEQSAQQALDQAQSEAQAALDKAWAQQ